MPTLENGSRVLAAKALDLRRSNITRSVIRQAEQARFDKHSCFVAVEQGADMQPIALERTRFAEDDRDGMDTAPLRGWGPGRNQEGPPGPNGIDVPEWSCDTTT